MLPVTYVSCYLFLMFLFLLWCAACALCNCKPALLSFPCSVCMAMIQSRKDYASNFYYHGLPKFLQSRLQVVQNKMIRYVLNYSNRTHLVANDFNEDKWMSIENRIKYLATSHVFNCIDEQAPEYLQVFERVNESHHYNTRHSVNALILPNVGSYGMKSFHYIGAKIWNSLPDEIQTTSSKSLFKVRCKKHFMSVISETKKKFFNSSPNVCIIYDSVVLSILSSGVDHYMGCHWTLGRLGPLWK